MHDDKTPHLALPLPHPGNTLAEDALRLRAALAALDSHLHGIDELLHTEDVDLDPVAEIVEAVKLAHEDIAGLKALIDAEINAALAALDERVGQTETGLGENADELTSTRDELARLMPLIYAGL
jgi:hypothetical protein